MKASIKWHSDCLLNRLLILTAKTRNIQLQNIGPLWGETNGARWIPITKISNAESISMSYRHHVWIKKKHSGPISFNRATSPCLVVLKQPGVSNHRQLDCLLNGSFRLTRMKTSNSASLALREGNPAVTAGFPTQRASNAVMIWSHHANRWLDGDVGPTSIHIQESSRKVISPHTFRPSGRHYIQYLHFIKTP